MAVNPELVSPCGLYCGVCAVRIAHAAGNETFKEKLAPVYGVTAEQIRCDGCLSDDVFVYCQVCPIKSCVTGRGVEGCHQCDAFPCEHIENFPVAAGKEVMLRAIPRWREVGTEKWVAEEQARYRCPSCGETLFRGARRCRSCREPISLG